METMYYNPNYNQKKHLTLRRKLRRKQTPVEAVLWKELCNKKFLGLKFYRQFGAGRYILDFFCPKLKLSVELDGGYHQKTHQREYDAVRTKYLRGEGIEELRFENEEVEQDIDDVIAAIKKTVDKLTKATANSLD